MNNPFPEVSRIKTSLTAVYMKHLDLYFSYQTLVAFRHHHPNEGILRVMCKNQWGRATATHLNIIEREWHPSITVRLDHIEFQKQIDKLNL
jgi:hypothetical protein